MGLEHVVRQQIFRGSNSFQCHWMRMQRAQEKAPRRGAPGLDGERGAEGSGCPRPTNQRNRISEVPLARLVWLAMISGEAAFNFNRSEQTGGIRWSPLQNGLSLLFRCCIRRSGTCSKSGTKKPTRIEANRSNRDEDGGRRFDRRISTRRIHSAPHPSRRGRVLCDPRGDGRNARRQAD